MIAHTEVARAMNTGALAAYKDAGVAYKHLLTGDACDTCLDAADDGDIPLDAPFSSGGILGLCHPGCRCVPAPAGTEAVPPLAHKSGDPPRVAWLLIRARDDHGKWRYLLQQRDDGDWGMPGGSAHPGEDGWDAAVREVTEEIGDIPQLRVVRDFTHADPDGKTSYLWLCEAPGMFTPRMNGSTPQETAGAAWFRRSQIGGLDLTSGFRGDWDGEIRLSDALKDDSLKSLQNMVTENGERIVLDGQEVSAQGGGARWPYPHNAQGAEWPDAGPGAVPGNSAGGEPPRSDPDGDSAGAVIYPRGSEDDKYPRRRIRSRPASRFPAQETDGTWPDGGIGAGPGPDAAGIPKNDSGHPVVGVYEPQALKPYNPRAVAPEPFDPADAVEELTPEGNTVHDVPGARKGAADFRDPNPVEAEHIYLAMAQNFPPEKIAWVKRATWQGPVSVPWDSIDTDDIDKWAASHQPGKVKEFERAITAHKGHVAPSILVQEPGRDKGFLVDGHHRAIARHNLKQDVLSYIGTIRPQDRMAALETHSAQLHQGNSPENK
jgi:8-oxo-dGTP pyrophosphatase MutT (NUDIX family)